VRKSSSDRRFLFRTTHLKRTSTVRQAAEKLGCSRAYIYKVLKANGLTIKEVLGAKEGWCFGEVIGYKERVVIYGRRTRAGGNS